MTPIFIPSYNRPAQLRLLLDSFNRNMEREYDLHIYYKADREYQSGYTKLFNDAHFNFPDLKIHWHEENNIFKQFYDFILNNSGNVVGFFMDDCIVYRPFLVGPTVTTQDLADVWCVSLRLGLNTVLHDYLGKSEMKAIEPDSEHGEFIKYDYTKYSPLENYGFCFSWDGCFYLANDLIRFFNCSNFYDDVSNKNSILFQRVENYSQNRRDRLSLKPEFLIPKESRVCCLNTSTTHAGSAGGRVYNYSLKEMNDRYLAGEVIDFDKLDFSNVRSCHIEIPMEWKKQ